MTQERDVFINCPFDQQYRRLLDAVIFAIHDCGFHSRSALEVEDSGEVRVQKIVRAIELVRNWLSTTPAARGLIPSGSVLAKRYRAYRKELPSWCAKRQLNPRRLTFRDHRTLVIAWLEANPWTPIF